MKLPREAIPVVEAYGKSVVAAKEAGDKPRYRIGAAGGFKVPMEDPATKRFDSAAE